MNQFYQSMPPDPKRLYRNTEDKMLGGVAAGIADYMGVDRVWVRLIFVVLFFVSGPIAIIGYPTLWVILPKRPTHLFRDKSEQSFWQSVNTRPGGTVSDLVRKFRDLDTRMARMERRVTQPDFDLDRKFRDLGA